MTLDILAVQRAPRYSPSSVAVDQRILTAVVQRLEQLTGAMAHWCSEDDLTDAVPMAGVVVSMARSRRALALLAAMERRGVVVVNTPQGVLHCTRTQLADIMAAEGLPQPPETGARGLWLKRGDGATQGPGDVVYCRDAAEAQRVRRSMEAAGIKDIVQTAHLTGDLVKFYGVGQRFFHWFYPTDNGHGKFGLERFNGAVHRYPFDTGLMAQQVQRLAAAVGVQFYGGDAIVGAQGQWHFIDFNDWPSFAPCVETAAAHGAELIVQQLKDR